MEKEMEAALHRIGVGLSEIASALQGRETDGHSFRDEAVIQLIKVLVSRDKSLLFEDPKWFVQQVFGIADAMELERLNRKELQPLQGIELEGLEP